MSGDTFLLAWFQFPLLPHRNFVALFFTCLAENIGFPCTKEACWKKINAHRLPICISLCAGWVCTTDLQWSLGLYMVPEKEYSSTRQWCGLHPVLLIHWCGFKCRSDFFCIFCQLSC